MFPRVPIRQVADSLLDFADAALSPEAEACEATEARPERVERPHPHRTKLRIQRERRRGAPLPRPQHCITPVSRPAPARPPLRRL